MTKKENARMSNAISIKGGAEFNGAGLVRDAGLKGMITLRGDLSSGKMAKAVQKTTGLAMPAPREILLNGDSGVAWMSPDELLLFCAYAQADAFVDTLDEALKGTHFLAVNVSDARARFSLQGQGVREVIAKGSPANMSPLALQPGEIRRTRLGQVAVAFWMLDADRLELVCFRSVGAFVYDWLCVAAAEHSLPEVI
jgi:sarcosine oxidase subunit gamma